MAGTGLGNSATIGANTVIVLATKLHRPIAVARLWIGKIALLLNEPRYAF